MSTDHTTAPPCPLKCTKVADEQELRVCFSQPHVGCSKLFTNGSTPNQSHTQSLGGNKKTDQMSQRCYESQLLGFLGDRWWTELCPGGGFARPFEVPSVNCFAPKWASGTSCMVVGCESRTVFGATGGMWLWCVTISAHKPSSCALQAPVQLLTLCGLVTLWQGLTAWALTRASPRRAPRCLGDVHAVQSDCPHTHSAALTCMRKWDRLPCVCAISHLGHMAIPHCSPVSHAHFP